jgi:NAD(P)-dependent dehydrogenase (short-subunit alcohol dehydrogenase family)
VDDTLSGRVALVSGAARGLGAAVAEQLAQQGARVLATDIRDDEGTRRVDGFHDPSSLRYQHLDVTCARDWDTAIDRCRRELGGLDILVSNAFYPAVAGLEEETVENWQRSLEVSLIGAFLGIRAALGVMRPARKGAIVTVSSTHGGDVAVSGLVAHQATKGALTALTRNAAVTYAPDGIRVNTVHPGPIHTPVIDELGMTEGQQAMGRDLPIGRVASADEVAGTIVFLASDRAAAITGTSVVVDGGYTAV